MSVLSFPVSEFCKIRHYLKKNPILTDIIFKQRLDIMSKQPDEVMFGKHLLQMSKNVLPYWSPFDRSQYMVI